MASPGLTPICHVFLVLCSPALDLALQMFLTRAKQKRRIALSDLPAVLLLIQLSTWKLPGHIADSCSVCGPSGTSLQRYFPAGQSQPVLVPGVVPSQKLTFAPVALVGLHKVLVSLFFQPLQVLLNGRCALQLVDCAHQSGKPVLFPRKNHNLIPDPDKKAYS